MNIKEHIEAGHYPTDDKGRALVPTRDGRVATIRAWDGPEGEELIGWQRNGGLGRDYVTTWQQSGQFAAASDGLDLLPPPPRKVKVTAYALLSGDGKIWDVRTDRSRVEQSRPDSAIPERWPVIELTGEYEEQW